MIQKRQIQIISLATAFTDTFPEPNIHIGCFSLTFPIFGLDHTRELNSHCVTPWTVRLCLPPLFLVGSSILVPLHVPPRPGLREKLSINVSTIRAHGCWRRLPFSVPHSLAIPFHLLIPEILPLVLPLSAQCCTAYQKKKKATMFAQFIYHTRVQ